MFFAPYGGKKKLALFIDKRIRIGHTIYIKGKRMHYIEVYDKDWRIEKILSYPAKDIGEVLAKIKSLNSANRRFKHYFIG